MKLVRRLANLGYGSRKEVARMLRNGWVTDAAGNSLGEDDTPAHEDVRVDDEPLDPAPGLLLMLHKPVGYTCSTKDAGRLVYELLPPRFRLRNPVLSTVGRLDRDTSGLLLMTDDGALLHTITSPRSHLPKVYRAVLANDLSGDEVAIFAAGGLLLENDDKPLAPAAMRVLGPREAELVLSEGRYHQVRRMFAAIGNHVAALHRPAIGGLDLGDLDAGHWRLLDPDDRARLFGHAVAAPA
jgi:16S rRNA pseudouridine516 synthase